MKKTVTALVAIAATAGLLVTVTPQAKAHDGVGAGIAAGLLGGAIVGGAIAASRPVYVAPAPVYVEAPPCYWQRQRYWDGYGWVIRPVRVCY
jgi:hypothetical protein